MRPRQLHVNLVDVDPRSSRRADSYSRNPDTASHHFSYCRFDSGCRRGGAMAASSPTDASLGDHSERAGAIDQLLLFLDNSRRPRQRPLTTGGIDGGTAVAPTSVSPRAGTRRAKSWDS